MKLSCYRCTEKLSNAHTAVTKHRIILRKITKSLKVKSTKAEETARLGLCSTTTLQKKLRNVNQKGQVGLSNRSKELYCTVIVINASNRN